MKVRKKQELTQALNGSLAQISVLRTAQQDMSLLPIDPPMTLIRLLDLMKRFMSKRDVLLEVMDSGEEAFLFRFIELEDADGGTIQLYVKAKLAADRKRMVIFAAHPDRRW